MKITEYSKNGFFSIILFYVLSDLITTYYALPYGYEGNPLLSSMLYDTGFYTLIIAKIAFFVFLVIVYEICLKKNVYAWFFTKNSIITIGMFLTLSNGFVITTGYDLITIFGMVFS